MKKKITKYFQWTYYPTAGQGYLKLRQGKIHNTTPLVEGRLLIDRDKKGDVIGIEFIK